MASNVMNGGGMLSPWTVESTFRGQKHQEQIKSPESYLQPPIKTGAITSYFLINLRKCSVSPSFRLINT